MATTSFNPRTAYREDWRYVDGVEDGVLVPCDSEGRDLNRHTDVKLVEGAVSHPALLGRAAGLRISTAQLTVWPLNYEADKPLEGYKFLRGVDSWAILQVEGEPFGKFFCLCSLLGVPEDRDAL